MAMPLYSNSYDKILVRMRRNLRQQNVSEDISKLLENAFSKALDEENIVLSRPDRVRLYKDVLKEVLAELLDQLDNKQMKLIVVIE